MKGLMKHEGRVLATVIRADGTVEDYGVVAGPILQVWWSKLKRMVKKLWQQ
jgi:hypothetical protein